LRHPFLFVESLLRNHAHADLVEQTGHSDFHLLFAGITELIGHADRIDGNVYRFVDQVAGPAFMPDCFDKQRILGGLRFHDPAKDSKTGIEGESLPLPYRGENIVKEKRGILVECIPIRRRFASVAPVGNFLTTRFGDRGGFFPDFGAVWQGRCPDDFSSR
jgi:hypothetical protein